MAVEVEVEVGIILDSYLLFTQHDHVIVDIIFLRNINGNTFQLINNSRHFDCDCLLFYQQVVVNNLQTMTSHRHNNKHKYNNLSRNKCKVEEEVEEIQMES